MFFEKSLLLNVKIALLSYKGAIFMWAISVSLTSCLTN